MKKELDYTAILTIHGTDKMDRRNLKKIKNWLAKVSDSLDTEAYAKTVRFKLMK